MNFKDVIWEAFDWVDLTQVEGFCDYGNELPGSNKGAKCILSGWGTISFSSTILLYVISQLTSCEQTIFYRKESSTNGFPCKRTERTKMEQRYQSTHSLFRIHAPDTLPKCKGALIPTELGGRVGPQFRSGRLGEENNQFLLL